MGKITNWSRENEYENEEKELTSNRTDKIIRAWQNDNTDSLAILKMSKNDNEDSPTFSYNFEVDGDTKFWTDVNQEEAKTKAKDWLEEHPYEEINLDGADLHDKLLEVGREVEPKEGGIANNLSDDEVETILGTVHFFDGPENKATIQTKRDLTQAQYRVFDWLGMMIDTDWNNDSLNWMFDTLAKIYIQEKSVSGFIHQLRMRDLQVEMPSELRRR